MRPFGNEASRTNRQPSSVEPMEGIFMSDTSKRTPDKSGIPFVDPWIKEPDHQGEVPIDAVFVGAWRRYVGIDHLYEA